MGYLPIILSLLGFLLLWGIVNYNSIRIRKNEAEQAETAVFDYAYLRNEAIRSLAALSKKGNPLEEILHFVKGQLDDSKKEELSIREKLSKERKVGELLADIPDNDANEAYHAAYERLQKAHQGYRQAATVYKRRVKDYNELIQKNPSRMLASLTGYKPIGTT